MSKIYSHELDAATNRAAQATDLSQASVIIVEDDLDAMSVLKTLLTHLCKVQYCEGRAMGAQLFGMLAANPRIRPDLILLDIEIPYEDGYLILQQIRERPLLQQTKVVAITASGHPREMERARAAGFDGYIAKPIDIDRFPDQIRRILAGEPVWER